MLNAVRTTQFKKDVKRLSRSSGSRDMSRLKEVIITLLNENQLEAHYRNHPLKSNWKGFFECHIEPDWLLIYRIRKDKGELELARTGSHAELFG